MSLYAGGMKIGKVIGLETYEGNITSPDMQYGSIGFAKGQKVVGTGRAFALAGYGGGKVQTVSDENGNIKYGFSLFMATAPNIIFLVPSTVGDISLQTEYAVDLANEKVCSIGINYTASGEIFVFYKQKRLTVYFANMQNKATEYKYFYGKDNKR